MIRVVAVIATASGGPVEVPPAALRRSVAAWSGVPLRFRRDARGALGHPVPVDAPGGEIGRLAAPRWDDEVRGVVARVDPIRSPGARAAWRWIRARVRSGRGVSLSMVARPTWNAATPGDVAEFVARRAASLEPVAVDVVRRPASRSRLLVAGGCL